MQSAVNSRSAGRLIAACAAIGTLAVGISACGSSSSSTTTAAAAGSSSSNARYQARLNLAKCLRAHGLNVPDPAPGGGVAGGGGGLGLRALRDNPNFQPALQACAKYRSSAFGFANASPAQRAQFQQDLVKFAECMRAHNINIPDPTTSSGGFRIFRQIPQSERDSPTFRTALQTCSTNLPFRKGGGPGGGAAGAGGSSTSPGA